MKSNIVFIIILCVAVFAGCRVNEVKEVKQIMVTSDSINQTGKLLTVTTASSNKPSGENITPQLTWDKVEGATCYAIYMVDESASNWLHWKATGIKESSLEQGVEIENSKYIGPYPPAGREHSYKIIVYALEAEADEYKGVFNGMNEKMGTIQDALDISGGKEGNIIGKGYTVGTYKSGEVNE